MKLFLPRPSSPPNIVFLLHLTCVVCSSSSSAPNALSKLQLELEKAHKCTTAVDGGFLLAVAIQQQRPNVVSLVRYTALYNISETFQVKANVTVEPSMYRHMNISHNGTFLLEQSCKDKKEEEEVRDESAASGRWKPVIVYKLLNGSALRVVLSPMDMHLCSLGTKGGCPITKCSASVHGGLRIYARDCPPDPNCHYFCRETEDRGRHLLIIFNALCAFACIALIPLVSSSRRSQHESRGWALMEIFLLGAAILYSILLLDWLPSPLLKWGCGMSVCLRQIGFAAFYGSIVLKIYRNLEEYRVRKAQHVSVREEDMLKYLACLMALTITGVVAWLAGASGNEDLWQTAWPQCTPHGWAFVSHCYELIFLIYGGTLCYKARNSDWLERWQFTVAVCLEAIVTLVANLIRYSIRYSGNSDTLFTVTFVQLQLTVSVNIVIIIAPKFYLVSGESSRRSLAMGGQSGRAHPSLAKLRDNILNGTIDFAEVPIIDMNPEDIRAELKRVYTQLRMYKLKNLYQDNPHISKRKGGGKRWSDKPKQPRRISIPNCSPQAKTRIEDEEKSDLTVESAPHNVLLSTSCQLQLEPNSSVRV